MYAISVLSTACTKSSRSSLFEPEAVLAVIIADPGDRASIIAILLVPITVATAGLLDS
jgi:hypothetical protein